MLNRLLKLQLMKGLFLLMNGLGKYLYSDGV